MGYHLRNLSAPPPDQARCCTLPASHTGPCQPATDPEGAPRVLFTAPEPHQHGAGLGTAPVGSYARCDCGGLLIFRGSSSGMVKWWPATRRERRRFNKLARTMGS